MPDSVKEAGKPSDETKSINDLFGTSDEPDDDPFNQLSDEAAEVVDEKEKTADGVDSRAEDVNINSAGVHGGRDEASKGDAKGSPKLPMSLLPKQVAEQAEDAFAGIGEAGNSGTDIEKDSNEGQDAAIPASLEDEDDDPFAGIGSSEQDNGDLEGGTVDYQAAETIPQLSAEGIQREKDYSDLLAEFEDDTAPLSPRSGDKAGNAPDAARIAAVPTTPNSAPSISQTAQALFEDDSEFDNFLGGTHNPVTPPETESPAPDLSIENSPPPEHPGDQSIQSLLSSASDWLDDTTMDHSFDLHADGETDEPFPALDSFKGVGPEREGKLEEEDVDVPEGWIDEYGNFQYYTEDDKLAVRESLLAERAAARAVEEEATPPISGESILPYIVTLINWLK